MPDRRDEPTTGRPGVSGVGPTLTGSAGDSDAAAGVTSSLPERIGPYQVEGLLGQGGMGVVYLARDPRLGRRVAVKVLPAGAGVMAAVRARFATEARALASLNHPNIAVVHSLEESDDGLAFFTMEWVPGGTLAERFAAGRLELGEALSLMRQLAAAIEAAHRRGVVHCDLKPRNLALDEEGRLKVLDFGLARIIGADAVATPAVRTIVAGTPGYMSPELVGGAEPKPAGDIWAFGCVLFECLTGRPAFTGDGRLGRMTAAVSGSWPRDALADLPEGLRDLVDRCLRKDPTARPDAPGVRRAIDELVAQQRFPRPSPDTGPIGPRAALGNLHRPLSPFVGRAEALAELTEVVRCEQLVTLTGAGGAGKTRLAIELGRRLGDRFPDGVWLVELAGTGRADLVADATAAALGIASQTVRSATDAVVEYLASRSLLLIVDNCEHLLDGVAGFVAELVNRSGAGQAAASGPIPDAAGVRIVATSRQRLGLAGERVYRVPTLSLPSSEDTAALRTSEAGRLFIQTAQAIDPKFAVDRDNATAVREICRRLDGIPLAIELAAVRTAVLSVGDIARRLDDRFRLLTQGTRGGLPHHRTLAALIDYSYELLPAAGRKMFRRLAVFPGGFDLEAAEQAWTAGQAPEVPGWEVLDLIGGLVDASLVDLDPERTARAGVTRYRMLETVRAYAADRLDAEEPELSALATARRRHFLSVARAACEDSAGPEQARVWNRLDADEDNLRAVLDTCARGDAAAEGLEIASWLGPYWMAHGRWRQGREYYAQLLGAAQEAPASARARALMWDGYLAFRLTSTDAAARFEAALELARAIDDVRVEASAVHGLGNIRFTEGEYLEARACWLASLALRRRLGVPADIALPLLNLAAVAEHLGDVEGAERAYRECLELLGSGNPHVRAQCLSNLGNVARQRGQLDRADEHYRRAGDLFRAVGDRFHIGITLANRALVHTALGDHRAAVAAVDEALAIWRELGDRHHSLRAQVHTVVLTLALADPARARAAMEEVVAMGSDVDDPESRAQVLAAATAWEFHQGRPEVAAILYGALSRTAASAWPQLALLGVSAEQLDEALGPAVAEQARARGAGLEFAAAMARVTGLRAR